MTPKYKLVIKGTCDVLAIIDFEAANFGEATTIANAISKVISDSTRSITEIVKLQRENGKQENQKDN